MHDERQLTPKYTGQCKYGHNEETVHTASSVSLEERDTWQGAACLHEVAGSDGFANVGVVVTRFEVRADQWCAQPCGYPHLRPEHDSIRGQAHPAPIKPSRILHTFSLPAQKLNACRAVHEQSESSCPTARHLRSSGKAQTERRLNESAEISSQRLLHAACQPGGGPSSV